MQCHTASWEDEENNRIVWLSVQYTIDGQEVAIESVTPRSVTFIDPATKKPTRSIKVWTDAGRKLLLKQYSQHVGLDRLQLAVEQHLAALV